MPRQETRLVGQGKDLLADALLERLPTAAGEVGAADAAAEDEVAAEADSVFGAVEDAMPGAVTGRVPHFEAEAAQAEGLAVDEVEAGRRAGRQGKAKQGRAASGVPQGAVGGMQGDDRRRVQAARQVASAADVVEVGMRDPDLADLPAALICFVQDESAIPGRVNDRRLARFGVGDQVTVGGNGSQDEGNDFEHVFSVTV